MERDNSKLSVEDEESSRLEGGNRGSNMAARSSKIFDKDNDEVKQTLMSNEDDGNETGGVKYIPANSINGDAKINIENVKAAFAGMGKEELMKFANDPFWVRVRWSLFIGFWLLWIGMLAGAICIVVVAPKCAAPAPLKWWEQGPLYKVDVGSFNHDLQGLQSKIEYLKDLGVKGIVIESLLKSSDSSPKSVVDFKSVNPLFGTLEAFKNLAKKIKAAGLHLVLSLVPNHSSIQHAWFNKSVHGEHPYADYYVWAKSTRVGADGNKLPPNNWLSVSGQSAWQWSEERQQFYLHQFHTSQPDLNYDNPLVVQEFKDILSFWLGQGVSGFVLERVDYLLENPALKDEVAATGPSNATHDDYHFYSHYHTTNQDGLEGLLTGWKEAVVNATGDNGLFVAERGSVLEPFSRNASDLLLNSDLFSTLKAGFSAQMLLDRTSLVLAHSGNVTRPAWQLYALAARLGPDYVDPFNMLAVMLPGTPIFQAGEELGQDTAANPLVWQTSNNTQGSEVVSVEAQLSDADSHLSVFRECAKLREEQSIMHGSYDITLVNNTVFTVSWLKSSNPGYLLAFNPSSSNVTVDLTSLDRVPDDLTVHVRSANYLADTDAPPRGQEVWLPPRAAVIFTYVPKKLQSE